MKNINKKFVQILNTFSAKDIREFRKFISSPFFAKGRNYIPLLEESLKTVSKKENKAVEIITKENNLSDKTIRNRYWELYKLAEDFIIYKDLSKNTIERNKILLRNLTEKKLYSSFNLRLKESLKILEKEKFSIKKHQDLSYVSLLNLNYLQDKNKADLYFENSFEISKNDLCLNLISFFEVGIYFINYKDNKFQFMTDYLQEFLKHLKVKSIDAGFEKSGSLIEKVTAMYYHLYRAFENKSEEKYFFRSREIFIELYPHLTDSFKISILHLMINYCINKRNEGVFKFNHELFRMFNEKLDQGLIPELEHGHNLFNHFRSYVSVGLSLKEYKWVEKFIAKYSDVLPIEFRDSEVTLTHSKLNFAKKKYKESLSCLDSIRTSQYMQYIDTSILKLCAYYELQDYDEAFLEMDKLNHYMRNHREVPDNFNAYTINFIKYYQMLLKLRSSGGNSISGFPKKEFESNIKISRREWLKEKLAELN